MMLWWWWWFIIIIVYGCSCCFSSSNSFCVISCCSCYWRFYGGDIGGVGFVDSVSAIFCDVVYIISICSWGNFNFTTWSLWLLACTLDYWSFCYLWQTVWARRRLSLIIILIDRLLIFIPLIYIPILNIIPLLPSPLITKIKNHLRPLLKLLIIVLLLLYILLHVIIVSWNILILPQFLIVNLFLYYFFIVVKIELFLLLSQVVYSLLIQFLVLLLWCFICVIIYFHLCFSLTTCLNRFFISRIRIKCRDRLFPTHNLLCHCWWMMLSDLISQSISYRWFNWRWLWW